jgi:DNA-binding CsgD family transcriptional regulator
MSKPRGTLVGEMSRRTASPVLIGRAREMAALEAAFDAVRAGGSATLLIGGEAGVGKTRLIGEFGEWVRTGQGLFLIGACLELGADGLPFGPFTAMLRDLIRETSAAQIAAMLPGGERATRELARLLPELAQDTVNGASGIGGEVSPAEEARARLFEEFLTLLERLAETRPVVVVVEDAHWADRSSRDLLTFLIRYQRSLPNVLIAATFRSDELHRTHPLRPVLADLARIDWVERIEVSPLTRGQAEELAAAILGQTPDSALADALYARAEGNPLFTEELLAAPGGGYDLPDSLADLLLQSVRRLPEDTQAVLRVASASPGGTGPALLAKVTGRAEEDLAGALRPAVTGNVLVTAADGYAFRHELIRAAVYEDLLPGEHGRIHSRYAEAIDEDPSLVLPGRAEIVQAHHWYAAHNMTWALISAWQAAMQASRSVAHAERLMLLARVLDLWDSVPDAAERIGASHVQVLEEAVDAARDAGEDQRGLGFATAAIAELDEHAEPARVAQLLGTRASFKRHLALPDSVQDVDRALSLVPGSVSMQVRAELLMVSTGNTSGLIEARVEQSVREALRIAREAAEPKAESKALAALAIIRASPGAQAAHDSEPLTLLALSRAAAERAGAYQPMFSAVVYESHLLCGAGEYERAAAAARQGIAAAERYGVTRTSGTFLAINEAEPLYALGRWDEALAIVGRALDLAPLPRTRIALWTLSGSIALARGDLGTAVKMAAAGRSVVSGLYYDDQFHLSHGLLDLELKLAAEGPAAAVALAAKQLDRYDLSRSGPRYLWPLLVVAAAAAAAAGTASAGALLDRVRTIAEKLAVFGPVQAAWQLTLTALDPPAELDLEIRIAAWDAAVTAWEALSQPKETASTLVFAARAALASATLPGNREAAAVWLRRAAPIAERLDARLLCEEIMTLSRRAGISLPGNAGVATASAEAAGGDHLGLTNREREVLCLLAAGQSNREIATALFISPKTASVHVSNILAKLGAATRTEAAARAHALHLFEDRLPALTAAPIRPARSEPDRNRAQFSLHKNPCTINLAP